MAGARRGVRRVPCGLPPVTLVRSTRPRSPCLALVPRSQYWVDRHYDEEHMPMTFEPRAFDEQLVRDLEEKREQAKLPRSKRWLQANAEAIEEASIKAGVVTHRVRVRDLAYTWPR